MSKKVPVVAVNLKTLRAKAFESYADAAKHIKCHQSSVRKATLGIEGKKQVKGHVFAQF